MIKNMVILLSSYFESKSTYYLLRQVSSKNSYGKSHYFNLEFRIRADFAFRHYRIQKEPGQNFESWAESGRVIIKRKWRQGLNTSKQGMLKFTLQPGGQLDMVWCYSGLKIDERN